MVALPRHPTPDHAGRVAEWFTGAATAPVHAIRASYRALERETVQLYEVIRRELGVRVDHARVVHDVFGHAALGLGFDVQAEYGTWLQCRTLFSAQARPAAFCELVGAVTAYVMTGEKPALRADLPPVELIAACEPDVALAA